MKDRLYLVEKHKPKQYIGLAREYGFTVRTVRGPSRITLYADKNEL